MDHANRVFFAMFDWELSKIPFSESQKNNIRFVVFFGENVWRRRNKKKMKKLRFHFLTIHIFSENGANTRYYRAQGAHQKHDEIAKIINIQIACNFVFFSLFRWQNDNEEINT